MVLKMSISKRIGCAAESAGSNATGSAGSNGGDRKSPSVPLFQRGKRNTDGTSQREAPLPLKKGGREGFSVVETQYCSSEIPAPLPLKKGGREEFAPLPLKKGGREGFSVVETRYGLPEIPAPLPLKKAGQEEFVPLPLKKAGREGFAPLPLKKGGREGFSVVETQYCSSEIRKNFPKIPASLTPNARTSLTLTMNSSTRARSFTRLNRSSLRCPWLCPEL